jgi:acyl carrier protein
MNDERTNKKIIVAYFSSNSSIEPKVLRQFLSERLPEYMLPSHYIQIDSIPIKPNGKVDRKSLPKPLQIDKIEVQIVPPQNNLEKDILESIKRVLQVDELSIDDNFFEIGADSSDMIKFNNNLKDVLKMDVKILSIFQYPTVRLLSDYLLSKNTQKPELLVQVSDEVDLTDTINLFD